MKIYCKIDGEFRIYKVHSSCHIEAINTVKSVMGARVALALFSNEGIGGAIAQEGIGIA